MLDDLSEPWKNIKRIDPDKAYLFFLALGKTNPKYWHYCRSSKRRRIRDKYWKRINREAAEIAAVAFQKGAQ